MATVPATIITGALGAGKTTLMRYILTQPHGYRIAVIENEFADSMGIESLILKAGVGGAIADGFFELANGCLCCTQRDGLVATLAKLMEMRERYDYILVETSGMADPGAVAATFWTDVGEGAAVNLDGIVTVVDAHALAGDLARPRTAGAVHEVERQIACADVLLLNKVDLLPVGGDAAAAARAQLTTSLRRINGLAPHVETVQGAVPLAAILNLRQYGEPSTAAALAAIAGPPAAAATCDHCGDAGCAADHHHDHAAPAAAAAAAAADGGHTHDAAITSYTVELPGVLRQVALQAALGTLLWEHTMPPPRPGEVLPPLPADGEPPLDILRVKALVWVADDADGADFGSAGGAAVIAAAPPAPPTPMLVQGVRDLFDIVPVPPHLLADAGGEPHVNRFVFIGTGIASPAARAALRSGLAACCVTAVVP